jgi:hypothetical protein
MSGLGRGHAQRLLDGVRLSLLRWREGNFHIGKAFPKRHYATQPFSWGQAGNLVLGKLHTCQCKSARAWSPGVALAPLDSGGGVLRSHKGVGRAGPLLGKNTVMHRAPG